MPLNESQRLCAEGFGTSLAVIAGAGSGKTFTLKERIANAFDPAIVAGRMEPVTSIDQIMAITFTNRAALELKSRIRSTLKARGLTDQALLVDTAWISTIHTMCARILRENALELGIDPAFEVVADERGEQLLSEAMEDVFQNMPELANDVSLLFEEYSLNTLKEMVKKLVDLAASSPDGYFSLQGPHAAKRSDLRAAEELSRTVGRYHVGGMDENARATAAEMADFIAQFGPSGELNLPDGTTLTWNIPWGEKEGLEGDALTNRIAFELRLLEGAKMWKSLVKVAEATTDRFTEYKLMNGYLDNSDLLVLAARALRMKGIRERYADRFRLVMVDEFQDTDQTQLDIIRVLSGPDCERLCVVGDPQQSIYRFRGADLSVCEGHLATIPDTPETQIHLDTNYRSHPDILDFVDVIFGAPRGGDVVDEATNRGFYQRLVAGRSEERVPASKRFTAAEGPRVEVVDVEYPTHGVKLGRSFAAAHIARRFNDIHEATGRPWSHMVILLGKMTNAQVYADALDKLGIPCAITGGSVFASRADTKVMLSLARVLANPREDNALLSVLASDIFGFSPDDLLEVRKLTHSRRLGTGFMMLMENMAQEIEPAPAAGSRLEHAAKVIRRAMFRAADENVARAMELVLAESGWLARREEEGSVTATSRAADALKLIRMVEDIEARGEPGARTVSDVLAARLDVAKEAPGVLQAERGDFVRIMTIHSSKGLQFPIVATAELEQGAAHNGKLTTQSSRGRTYVSLDLEHTLQSTEGSLSSCTKIRDSLLRNVCDAAAAERPFDNATFRRLLDHDSAASMGARDALIRAFGADQDDLELERKIYVSFTRAEEALIVCLFSSATATTIKRRIKAFPTDELGAKRALTLSTSSAKKYTQEEKDEAKILVERFVNHLCIPFAGAPKGMCGRIRARHATIEAAGYSYRHAPSAYVRRWNVTGEWPPNWSGEANVEGAFAEFEDITAAEELPSMAPLAELPYERDLSSVGMFRYAPMGGLGMLSASALHHAHDVAPAVQPIRVSFADDVEPEASATERGSAFHLMGEVAARRWKPGCALELPKDRLAPTARLYGLSSRQEGQLAQEMFAWLESDVARDMAAHAFLEPEAPFSVQLPTIEGVAPLVLTGFIDLLAYNERGSGAAHVVDYKTGTFLDTDEKRREAYEVQARCYAYALMCQGFTEVSLEFVFVDQPTEDDMPALCTFPAPGEPAWTRSELEEFLSREVCHMLGL